MPKTYSSAQLALLKAIARGERYAHLRGRGDLTIKSLHRRGLIRSKRVFAGAEHILTEKGQALYAEVRDR